MYLKKTYRKESGRTYLVIAQKYRNPVTNISTDRTIKSLGYLDELEKEYDDPIAHFKEVARKMTEEENTKKKLTLTINMDEQLAQGADDRKNFGYVAILKIYHELGLHRFFNNRARNQDFKFNTNSIMMLLVVSRLLSPGSKKKAFEERRRYFERFNFSLGDVYRALSHFAKIFREFQRYLHGQIAEKYGSNTKTIYYDVTNFYFEIDEADELRKYGRSKEHRHDPVVQMGLAMDADGIPLHYELFPGNKLDKETFRSVIGEVRKNYGTGRIVVVADMGIITGDNIYYLTSGKNRNGYVFSFSVRGGTDAFRNYVLDNEGYVGSDGKPAGEDAEFKIKSRRIARDIIVNMKSGKTAKKTVYEKQVVFWAKKYADKARAEREEVVKKALDLVADPKKYNKAITYGAAKYVKHLEFDKETGEVLVSKQRPCFHSDKLVQDELYDGYYAIVTSELQMSDGEIIDTYRGLWEIEETFRVTKGTLETRPVYVSREDRIAAHFLTCFIALVILRLIQKKTNRRYSSERIVECLNRIACSNEQDNLYMFDYRSEISDAIGNALDIDFTRKRLRLSDIKNILANSKK
ncbi:Transposase DDE domain-containing protein [Desulfotomaculum arcticum]|uniref:Transposase DDE domain-containing protein n=1 Tax=Desulfotruncus arcticus DSM 17038 TaxID=1121424 RepID=A0A1I2SLR5_9FIRM|nr:IS1634 family transposase [Desulfotruncus arcticus]SFG53718.1 Transposase DDE domain-containing protein [Desulfotomaculum arcticum] [Desulfotruncus arcticus DSM 17038]